MGLFDGLQRLFSRQQEPAKLSEIEVGAEVDTAGDDIRVFSNDKITFSGSLSGYNYTAILKDKEKNIVQLYELSDYFVDADPIYRGIIKHVYAPYATSTPYKLVGGTEKTRAKYMDYYSRIRLSEKWKSIAYQFFKYANVFIYWFDGNILTLPPHMCRIAAISLNGDPVVEYNVESITRGHGDMSAEARKKFIDDTRLQTILKGYPPEIAEGIRAGAQWVQ